MNMKEILIKVYLMGCSRSTIAKILRIVHSKTDVEKLSELIEHCQTEEEILAAIATMEKATEKATTDDAQE